MSIRGVAPETRASRGGPCCLALWCRRLGVLGVLVMSAVGTSGCAHLRSAAKPPGLIQALRELARAEERRDWEAMYAMLSPAFRPWGSSLLFADEMEARTARARLVSWRVVELSRDEEGKATSAWVFVTGCGCYAVETGYKAWLATTIAVPRQGGWGFGVLSVVQPLDGAKTECPAAVIPEGPCRRPRPRMPGAASGHR
jgi:hypothetical protein